MFECNQSKWGESNVIGLHTYVRYNTDENQSYGTQQTTVIILLFYYSLFQRYIALKYQLSPLSLENNSLRFQTTSSRFASYFFRTGLIIH